MFLDKENLRRKLENYLMSNETYEVKKTWFF